VLAFETLAGRPLFEASNTQALIAAHITQLPPRLHEVRPEVPRALSELVSRCLEKSPARRWQHASDIVKRLRAMERGDTSATGAGCRRWVGRAAGVAILAAWGIWG
jgi:serine/threonine protein kinase